MAERRRAQVSFDDAGAEMEFISLAKRTTTLLEELNKSTELRRLLGKRRNKDAIIEDLRELQSDIDAAINNLGYRKRISSFVELKEQIKQALNAA